MRNVLRFGKSLLVAGVLFTSVNCMAQVREKWVKRQNGDANNYDKANALIVDQYCNVIVTGLSEGKGSGYDYATIKYSDEGEAKWIKRFNGPANGDDEAAATAIDNKGNVYVTGLSTGSGTETDFATIMYDEEGNTKWVQRFNGPGNGADIATAIAVDKDGNVYVTGHSTGKGTGFDITTIKYDNNGNAKWVKRYNGPGNGDDEATAIAIDNNGNVYVTGWSTGNGTGGDYTTIKYDNNGSQQWVNRYNGPINDFDIANALAVDGAGNVYVTGYITRIENQGEGSATDIATIKYNASGIQQWAIIYNKQSRDEAYALKIDQAGNVYITGMSGPTVEDPENDYVTIKYNTNGIQQWAAIFSGAGYGFFGSDAFATNLELDAAGNVYVTGGSSIRAELDYVTIKYNANGVQQWLASYDGPGNDIDRASAIGLDKNGNVYITGPSSLGNNADYATIKYNSAGMQKWLRRYNGPGGELKGGDDVATALAVDKDGNVHVTGGMTRLITGSDYTTFKYNTNGDRDWKKTYNGPGTGPDQASAIILDAQGNVYVTGSSFGKGSLADFTTVKYDAAGNTQWGKRYNGPDNLSDKANAIAVDAQGNVYVTGISTAGNLYGDYVTIKYDAAGNTKWVKRYNGPGNSLDEPVAIAVDASGNVYVTGTSYDVTSFADFATVKYDANGNQQWVARFNAPYNADDEPKKLVVDALGNVFVTGYSWGNSGTIDYTTIKYNTAGVQQWLARYDSPDNGFDTPNDLTIDAAGNVYVTGSSGNFGSGADMTTIKYNAAGVQQWAASYDAANSEDIGNALAVDAQGNVYVTGSSRLDNNLFEDYATVKYNAKGVQQWVARYTGPGNHTDMPTGIGLDKNGNVYVTGYSFGDGTSNDYTTIKYEQTPLVTMSSAIDPVPNNLAIEQREPAKLTVKAFPNAFTQYINLQWSGSDGPVTITITDNMGRLVDKRTGLAASGTLQTGNKFTQGVYFAEIVQGKEKIIVKLVKN
ncbi:MULTISPECIES: SBBP repeat-containing protein [Niastella]|uniref:SBBP repeat-containing protein n=1 Tax=Niastella soli TaxID=2821487 RepID=A0ABS3YUP4_9BACT|nr:SBBP repeat-containing protein [Niastella soli]MBO9201622.1 SBBP repeat-containing protein [Niastella soli]